MWNTTRNFSRYHLQYKIIRENDVNLEPSMTRHATVNIFPFYTFNIVIESVDLL